MTNQTDQPTETDAAATRRRLGDLPGYEGRDGAAVVAELRRKLGKRVRRATDLGAWAVVVRPEGATVIARSQLVADLRAADLPREARAALLWRVPAGAVLVWLESEGETGLAVWSVTA